LVANPASTTLAALFSIKLIYEQRRKDVEIVEIDGSGRIYIPAEIRRRVKARRFRLKVTEGGILLEPIDDVDVYYGRFGPANVDEIERALEDAAQVDLR
jgi:bifunctional DNA-binding transcriptional regulator/antitoxin component of YhaV-PrlF toxin-antitoxin module